MKLSVLIIVCVCVAAVVANKDATTQSRRKPKKMPQTLSRGWADEAEWVQTYSEGLYRAKKEGKPLMVIHHLEECPYSQGLKKAFAENAEAQKMADKDFIILNLVFETHDKHLAPDGYYVPRIMFVDPSLTVRADIAGKYSDKLYTYQPEDLNLLVANMKKAKILLHTEF
ncbi:anterior gradient protein 3-like [Lethenteron reissneri]|uniref:anterior gradient protein 3-like n=1 Tax=Lethenteron reissneri TaxID=7753 RepID=UPI002AB7BF8A|nr:anterior gradient protein 3-like [Lethenteron reissneri]